MKRNVIVGQSGGPTAAINSSLAGVYRTAIDRGANKVYGMLHGIQGLLEEKYIDLTANDRKRNGTEKNGLCRNLPGNQEKKGFKSFRREKWRQANFQSVQILLSLTLDSPGETVLLLK